SGATTGMGQTCVISQTGPGANTAGVFEKHQKISGLVQTAQYGASITQTSASGDNTACVTQMISLDGSTSNTNTKGVAVNLNAFQTITITQNSATGNNSAQKAAPATGTCDTNPTAIPQFQALGSTGNTKGPITQNQDLL